VPGLAFDGDLVFLHGFQQRTLRARSRPVDFVSQHHVGEYRSRMELETAGVAVVDRNAQDVGGQQVAGELDALETQAQRCRDGMGQRGFADAGHVLDQKVAACQKAGNGKPDLL
jgi:hypothetical protein